MPSILQLSAERIDSTGVYVLDDGETLVIFVGHNVPPLICQNLFGCSTFAAIPDDLVSIFIFTFFFSSSRIIIQIYPLLG